MLLFSIITALAVYYLLVFGWYHRLKNRNMASESALQNETTEPLNRDSLVGVTRYRSGLIRSSVDDCGHIPQAIGNDTTFATEAAEPIEEMEFEMTFDEPDETDVEDEEIASYLMDDETGQATGVEFDKLGEAVRTANNTDASEADKQQAADTLTRIAGTNLYDAVVANINGGVQQVAELLKHNEAALLATASSAAEENPELAEFDMNDFL